MKIFLTLFILLLNSSLVFACNITESELMIRVAIIKSDFTEQMSLRETTHGNLIEEGNVSKKEFLSLVDSVRKVYNPIFRNLKMDFKIEHLWEDNQVNAFSGMRRGDRYIVLYGGYARHRLMTKDAYLSVICHEIGHHLGGFPKKELTTWSSSEGQADYFSTLKCMKEVLRLDPLNEEIAVSLSVDLPDLVKKQCSFQYPRINDYNICLRSAKAAEDHGRVIADLRREGTEVSLMTPSIEHEMETNLKHPSAQCRVDTKYQGALCNVSTLIPLDNHDETKGACHFNNFNILGNRPACWFNHKK
jgi:hypothetical protein